MATLIFSLLISMYFLAYYPVNTSLGAVYELVRYPIIWFIIFELISIFRYKVIKRTWNYCSLDDLYCIIKAGAISAGVVFALKFATGDSRYIKLLFLSIIFFMISYNLIRLSFRLSRDHWKVSAGMKNKMTRTLIVGAGDAGNLLVSQLKKYRDAVICPVGYVDDDPQKEGALIHNIPVLGTTDDIKRVVLENDIHQITIAMPSVSRSDQKIILEKCIETKVPVNIMPKVEDVMSGKLQINSFREIEIEDLLGRDPIKFDTDSIEAQVSGKIVMVTGAGGSIGSEICRQILKFHPRRLVLLGHGENSIYEIHRELLKVGTTTELIPAIADVQDIERLRDVMGTYKPFIIYHAAAHKHVPLMEISPREAIKNNVFGSRNVARAAMENDVDTMVMVSTDKAVNPTSIMGASKRIAEIITQSYNKKGRTKFVAVRFGNVLGSRGSVVPLFKKQLQSGGPITITDKRMTRYFMTIPEASQLVIQAGALAKGGEIFVLDMGEMVKIVDLAKKMIKLYGYEEGEIPIVEVGMRPGEKLYEETLSSSEKVSEQIFPKIFVGKSVQVPREMVDEFTEHVESYSEETLREKAMKIAKYGYDKSDSEEEFKKIIEIEEFEKNRAKKEVLA